ncbi:NAD-dependent epimerase/dehydratase family protein [Parabacteroides timonensis]|uniref:NAD-dependent epimerase/dehydratase family protein n=1 Tax=Parabacteroides timonensis TaxID=1871013 RepID=UPI00094E9F38|nr:NAD-dependent epimerase/dehydratase family protein [Parabacteroides timonensis]
MKITLIGASGFVGTRLIEYLRPTLYSLQNIDKRQSLSYPKITTVANVLDKEKLVSLLAGTDVVVLLAAEHRDDVSPVSLYYDVNVGGMRNTLKAMEINGIKRIVFTSSVAVYGLNKKCPDENHPADPFNHYGKSKWEAELVLQKWYQTHSDWNINIIRPTVIFGERNRGNVYNLLRQISSGKFLMVGNGNNKKSMAYVGNIVAFLEFLITEKTAGYNVYNYVDQPDFTMNELVEHVSKVLKIHIPTTHFPFWLGMLGGYCFDLLAFLSRRKQTISSVRVKKFCATTQFNAGKIQQSGFKAPYTLGEGLAKTLEFEFL